MAGKKFLSGIDLVNQRAINSASPSAGTDLANKDYVDGVARGLQWKVPVRAATTANAALATAYENADVIDGVTLATGDRILIKDQTTQSENGIYTVNVSGAPTRATDMAAASDAKGATVTVLEGTVAANKVYNQTTEPATVGTHNLVWGIVGGSGATYVAGSGLSDSPTNTFNVDTGTASATGLEISSDTVRIAAVAAGAGLTGGGGSALAVGAGTGVTVNANDVAIDTAVVPRKFAVDVGDNASTAIVITHSLGTRDVQVQVYLAATPWETVECDVERTSTTTCTLRFAVAPTTAQYRAVVIG